MRSYISFSCASARVGGNRGLYGQKCLGTTAVLCIRTTTAISPLTGQAVVELGNKSNLNDKDLLSLAQFLVHMGVHMICISRGWGVLQLKPCNLLL